MNRLVRSLLSPGVRLMASLQLPVKLGLMAFALFVPMLLLAFQTARSGLEDVAFTQQERAGAVLVNALMRVALPLQDHRALSYRVMNTDASATPARDAARKALQAGVASADTAFADPQPFDVKDLWTPLQGRIATLAQGQHDAQRQRAFVQHTEVLEALRGEIIRVAERSGLLLDPKAATYFTMDAVVERTFPWIEALSDTQGNASGLLARGDATSAERAHVLGRVESLRRVMSDADLRTGALQRAGKTLPPAYKTAVAETQAFADAVQALFSSEVLDGDAVKTFEQGQRARAAVMAFHDDLAAQLLSDLDERIETQHRWLLLEVTTTVAGLSLLLYLCLAFSTSFTGALRALRKGMQAVTDGDLSYRFEVRGKDELAQLGALNETMAERLSVMVAEIRSSAVRVSNSGEQLAQGTQALAQRTDSQASSLRQSVTTVDQLSARVAHNATEASQLDSLTTDLRGRAEEGGRAMRDTIDSLGGLEGSSKKVSEIVSVIDGIAFQTNILALNAAVEAARAGESGRGFAVVAAEVRQLAQRSGAAAGEIRGLIAQSQQQVGATVRRVQDTGQTLEAVIAGVRDVSQSLRGIAQASAEQSLGLQEIASSVGNLDEITRQNAALVDESSLATQTLVERAQALSQAVASIRLRQGSADEARELVSRAAALIARQGRAGASAALHSAASGFVDRDLYIFVLDREGRYVVHGAKPASEGRHVREFLGAEGDRFVRDAWAAAQVGGEWVEYAIVNPETGKIQPKASWIQPLDEQTLLGCGIYRQESASAAQPPSRVTPEAAAAPAAPRLASRRPAVA